MHGGEVQYTDGTRNRQNYVFSYTYDIILKKEAQASPCSLSLPLLLRRQHRTQTWMALLSVLSCLLLQLL